MFGSSSRLSLSASFLAIICETAYPVGETTSNLEPPAPSLASSSSLEP